MRILIADDDFASRVILGAFLKRSGHEVIEAVDGAEEATASVEAETAQATEPETPEPGDEKVALAPALWLDPDVRWLTGVHEAEGHLYLVRELYEELLWWLLMPSLLRLADEAAPSRDAVEELSKTVEDALKTAEAAGYRIDTLLGETAAGDDGEPSAAEDESSIPGEGRPQAEEPEPAEAPRGPAIHPPEPE